ncbi:MAG: trehalose-phosphatase, partial [Candidatus Binatia bacterium]
HDKTGVLVLSEMAGASKELPEAIIINPNNREEIADALKTALEMPREEQIRRNTIMQNRLRRYDVARWAMDFLVELLSTSPVDEVSSVKWLEAPVCRALADHYSRGKRRLLILDYDGTLVPFAAYPEVAKPTLAVLRLLRTLADDSRNELVLATGRDRATLDQWFGGVPIALAAEHGAWIKELHGDWRMQQSLPLEWKEKLLPILEMYADRVSGAFVEEKDFSLVWHYRIADPEQGRAAARELTDHLLVFTASMDLQVLRGSKAIEIRKAGINKGAAVQRWLCKNDFDFILAIGDDLTDEDMFAVLPEWAYSFRVGVNRTHARFRLRDPSEVLQFLADLSAHQDNHSHDHDASLGVKPGSHNQPI